VALLTASSSTADTPSEAGSPSLSAEFSPQRIARNHFAPISLQLGFTVPKQEDESPELGSIRLAVSRHVRFHFAGLPSCSLGALFNYESQRCADSLVGSGHVTSEVTLPGKQPATVHGKLKAYYSDEGEQPRILARVVSRKPAVVYVIPFELQSTPGRYSTRLMVRQMRNVIRGRCGSYGCHPYSLKGIYSQISEFALSLYRRYRHAGREVNVVSAECPARARQMGSDFPLARMNLSYNGIAHPAEQDGHCTVFG
jgi:hypothetical protein